MAANTNATNFAVTTPAPARAISSRQSTYSQSGSGSASTATASRNRQYTHLQSQLAQLNAHLSDLENLVGMTAVQADYIKGLGAWWGGTFMAASKILGEEGATNAEAMPLSGDKDES